MNVKHVVLNALILPVSGLSYPVMGHAGLGQTAAGGIVVHNDFLAYLVACPFVCQFAHFQDPAGHLET